MGRRRRLVRRDPALREVLEVGAAVRQPELAAEAVLREVDPDLAIELMRDAARLRLS
jgi:hypothetical protein